MPWLNNLEMQAVGHFEISRRIFITCHFREGGNPGAKALCPTWIPAFAGMTGEKVQRGN
jgi:hypothetical protein